MRKCIQTQTRTQKQTQIKAQTHKHKEEIHTWGKWCKCKYEPTSTLASIETSFVPRTSKSSPIYINIAYPSLTLIFSLSGSFWAPIEVLYLKQLPSECYRPHQTSYLYSNPCFIISRMGWNKGNTFMFTLKLVWTINYNTSDEIHNPKFCFTKDFILCDCLIDVAEWSLPKLLLKGLVSQLLTFLFHSPAWPVGKTFEGCRI